MTGDGLGRWGIPLVGGLGAIFVGLTVVHDRVLLVLAAVGLLIGLASLRWIWVIAVMALLALSLDSMGNLDYVLLGIPITVAKITVVAWVGIWILYAQSKRLDLFLWTPLSTGYLLLLGSLVFSLLLHGFSIVGSYRLQSLVLVAVMVHLAYSTLSLDEVYPILRGYLWVLLALMAYGTLTLDEAGRATSTFGNSNNWAAFQLAVFPLLLHVAGSSHSWFWRVGYYAILVATPASVYLTGSRAGLLTLGVMLALLVPRMRPSTIVTGGVAAAAAVALAFTSQTDVIADRYLGILEEGGIDQDNSISLRSMTLRYGVRFFLENPIDGIGAGRFMENISARDPLGVGLIAHNQYLTIASEQGMIGLFALSIFGLQLVRTLWTMWVRARGGPHAGLVYAMAVQTAGMAFFGTTMEVLHQSWFHLLLGFQMAAARTLLHGRPAEEGPPEPAQPLSLPRNTTSAATTR